ncbi:MAG: hypothetical protein GW938_02025 [Leptospira sp.]|nr:hypothetical protein [Leptospira sp.]NCS92881.1 hypothetical protein [Leptospira sp.]
MRNFGIKSIWLFLFLISSILNSILLYLLWNQNNYKNEEVNLPTQVDASLDSVVSKSVNLKKRIIEPSTSVVYIKPHPPDFLNGRTMKIQRFDKSIIDGKEIWRLEEITEDNKVRIWNIDSSSIVW